MKKAIKYLGIAFVGVILLLGVSKMFRNYQDLKTEPTATEIQTDDNPINKPSNSLTYNCEPGKTAFEILEEISTTPPETKDFSFGKQILSVNGIEQSDNKYWLYTVADKEATVSADNYTCQDNEQIKWELK